MAKIKIFTGIFLLFFLLILTGCTENKKIDEKDRFIGSWISNNEEMLIFYDVKTCHFMNFNGTWNLQDEKIFITLDFEGGKNKMSFDYIFSEENTIITLTDPSERTWIFYKQ